MKLVVTIIGKDRVGIIAAVANILADNNVNILSINQNIMDGFFNMVMMAELLDDKITVGELQNILHAKGEEIQMDIKVQSQEIFNVMHTI